MEFLGLAFLTGVAMASSKMTEQPNFDNVTSNLPATVYAKQMTRDFQDAGIPYFQTRSFNQSQAEIGNSYRPLSYPVQEPTSNFSDVAADTAGRFALFEAEWPRYFFENLGRLGITYGPNQRNNGYNIGVQKEGVSFSGDPDYSLAKLGKVFVDRYEWPDQPTYTGWYNMKSGEPTIINRAELPSDGDVPINYRNPYGIHGYYQRIFQNQMAEFATKKGNLKPTVLEKPPFKRNTVGLENRIMGKQLPQTLGIQSLMR